MAVKNQAALDAIVREEMEYLTALVSEEEDGPPAKRPKKRGGASKNKMEADELLDAIYNAITVRLRDGACGVPPKP